MLKEGGITNGNQKQGVAVKLCGAVGKPNRDYCDQMTFEMGEQFSGMVDPKLSRVWRPSLADDRRHGNGSSEKREKQLEQLSSVEALGQLDAGRVRVNIPPEQFRDRGGRRSELVGFE
jgi:hypothetical protein